MLDLLEALSWIVTIFAVVYILIDLFTWRKPR